MRTELIQCPECGDYFNPEYLDQAILHMHNGFLINETIKGRKVMDIDPQDLPAYRRSLNPDPSEQGFCIYGREDHLWRNGEYLGIATWTKDENVGDCFQQIVFENGINSRKVFTADRWELIL